MAIQVFANIVGSAVDESGRRISLEFRGFSVKQLSNFCAITGYSDCRLAWHNAVCRLEWLELFTTDKSRIQ